MPDQSAAATFDSTEALPDLGEPREFGEVASLRLLLFTPDRVVISDSASGGY